MMLYQQIQYWKIKIGKDGTPYLVFDKGFRGADDFAPLPDEMTINNEGIMYIHRGKNGMSCKYDCRFSKCNFRGISTPVEKLKEIGCISSDDVKQHPLSFLYEYIVGVRHSHNSIFKGKFPFDKDNLLLKYKDSQRYLEKLDLEVFEKTILDACSLEG